jgi:UTP--glucose-1-phosphate uridylyltransferase
MIKKAIIPVAGWGTRWLPITKAIEKCMLPIGNRPIVDYVVKDCIDAGISDIYFIVSEDSSQLRQYYSDNEKLNQYLKVNGKTDKLDALQLSTDANFHFIKQKQNGKYGTAVPVSMISPYIDDNESVVVLMGDDFVYNADGSNEIQRLIEETETGGNSLLGVNIPIDQVNRYGVIEVSLNREFVSIVEKPTPEEAPSTLINISKYVLSSDVIRLIVDFVAKEKEGEYYITDVINQYVSGGGSVKVVEAQGGYLDGGNPESWLYANRVVMGDLA